MAAVIHRRIPGGVKVTCGAESQLYGDVRDAVIPSEEFGDALA